jgi:hypothetical protein
MGVALTNPNDRRRLNLMARALVKSQGTSHPYSAADVVALWLKNKTNSAFRENVLGGELGLSVKGKRERYAKGSFNGETMPAVFAAAFKNAQEMAADPNGAAKAKARRKAYAQAKRDIALELESQGGPKYKFSRKLKHFNGKGVAPTYEEVSYAKRLLGSKASRYLLKAKKGAAVAYTSTLPKNAERKGKAQRTRRLFNRFEYTPKGVNVATIREWNKRHQEQRPAPGQTSRKFEPKEQLITRNGKTYSVVFSDQLRSWENQKKAKSNPGIFGGVALTNPGIFGGVALTNPTVEGTVDYVKYALPIAAGAGVGVLAHYYLVPMIDENVYSKIPVVGEYLSEYGYAATGLLAGAALGAGAAMLDGDLRQYAALAAAGVIAAGGALQVAQALGLLNAESDSGDELEAENNPGIFGGVALTNGGIFGNLAGASDVENHVGLLRGFASTGRVTSARRNQFSRDMQAQGYSTGEVGDLIRVATKASDFEKERRASKNATKKRKLADKRDKQLEYFDKYADELTSNAAGVSAAGGGAVAAQAQANPGIFSGVALTNPGIFGALGMAGGYGDGMAYEIASITPVDETAHAYSGAGAAMADAMHCGADLDVVEGQAAVAGEGAWNAKFGAPPVRISPMGGAQGSASHLAGRQGHRWGWLIKMVGFPQFQKMAALPPAQRLNVIQRVRKAAVDTFTREMAAANAGAAEAQENPGIFGDLGASGAFTSEGAGTSYGSTLFAADASF